MAQLILISDEGDLITPELIKEASDVAGRLSVHFSSENAEWYTPPLILECVRRSLGGIDLDPCSSDTANKAVGAELYFTKDTDGLANTWYGRVFMNPPYGREIGTWTDKLLYHYEKGHVTAAVALVPGRVDTGWFRRLYPFPVCMINGRLTFSGCETAAPFPSVAVYIGDDANRFTEIWSEVGRIYTGVE